MNTFRFTKEAECWYVDFPKHLQHRCSKTQQILVDGARSILNKIANGAKEITLMMDTRPLQDADVLELQQLVKEPWGGGYYLMRNGIGKVVKANMWLCDIPLFIFGDLPDRIYIKKISAN